MYRYSPVKTDNTLSERAKMSKLDEVRHNFLGDTTRIIFWADYMSKVQSGLAQIQVMVRIALTSIAFSDHVE